MNVRKVKGRMTEMGISGEMLAKEMNINPSTFYRKMKKEGETFTIGEIRAMKQILEFNDQQAAEILLA